MTREQIEAWRVLLDHHEGTGELCDLAERALLLEDVLAAAQAYLGMYHRDQRANLVAAIDRAEGK